MSKNRRRIKIAKKTKEVFKKIFYELINNLPFKLTSDQSNVLVKLNNDLLNNKRMFRILQGDVGSGKTIVSFLSMANVIEININVL